MLTSYGEGKTKQNKQQNRKHTPKKQESFPDLILWHTVTSPGQKRKEPPHTPHLWSLKQNSLHEVATAQRAD